MTRFNRDGVSSAWRLEANGSATVYCKLFSDTVSEQLCELRKKELIVKGGFSCEGCSRGRDHQYAAEACDGVLGTGHGRISGKR